MNLLFFASDVARQSGASFALREIIRRLSTKGLNPVVVIPDTVDSREMFPESEFQVIYLNMQRARRTLNVAVQARYVRFFSPTLIQLCRIIRDRRIDIVHFNEITDFIGGIAARLSGIPSVCHIRADGIPNPYRSVLIAILRRVADTVIVPSKSTLAWIAADSKKLVPKIKVIYDYAFDPASYNPGISGAKFRQDIGIGLGDIIVLLVSKLMVQKGHLCFIKAAGEILRKRTGIAFVVAGGVVDGHDHEANKIISLAEKLTPDPVLKFIGARSDLPAVFAASDIVVHCPIYPDPYPTVVLLGMLMGKPVIGSDIGGIPEQIEDGVNGMLVPPDDPAALAGAILKLAENPERREILGVAAMEKVRKNFEPGKQAGMLIDVYEDLLTKKQV